MNELLVWSMSSLHNRFHYILDDVCNSTCFSTAFPISLTVCDCPSLALLPDDKAGVPWLVCSPSRPVKVGPVWVSGAGTTLTDGCFSSLETGLKDSVIVCDLNAGDDKLKSCFCASVLWSSRFWGVFLLAGKSKSNSSSESPLLFAVVFFSMLKALLSCIL